MDETISNIHFLKETIGKFKDEIQKFISDPNYATNNAMNLRQSVEAMEKNILTKEKNIANQILNNNSNNYNSIMIKPNLPGIIESTTFPDISNTNRNTYNTLRYEKRSTSNTSLTGNSNFSRAKPSFASNTFNFQSNNIKQEREEFKNNVYQRRDYLGQNENLHSVISARREVYKDKKETFHLLKKYNLETNRKVKAKRSVGVSNFMDKNVLQKYSSFNKNSFRGILLDQNNKPVITKDEMNKGMLNMIYKGIIPKTADLTPAFNREGHPLQLNLKVKEIYSKSKTRDEIETETPLERIKYNLEDIRMGNNIKDNLFITGNQKGQMTSLQSGNNSIFSGISQGRMQNNMISEREHKDELTTNERRKEEDTLENKFTHKEELYEELIKNEEHLTIDDIIPPHRIILLFSGFKIVLNDDYHMFKTNNDERWGNISYLIEHLQKLFKKLNIPIAEVDSLKLEKLASDELRNINNKDLISCLTDKDMVSKGLDIHNPKKLYSNLRESFALRIQNSYRVYMAKKKAKNLKELMSKISKIQRCYRLTKLIQISRGLAKEKFAERYEKWKEMMSIFKNKWSHIKNEKRVEIHINSLTYNSYKNCTIEKYTEKENNQLTRLIALADPNVEIIYISPYQLGNEILSYYFSILQILGIENAKNRFHLVVPELCQHLPPNFSLAQLLWYSCKSLKMIKHHIRGKNAIIYPGIVNRYDIELSMYLEIPIMMGDFEMTQALFTKSGSKRVFELTNMALPISAWDIKNEEEFYSSLTSLVKNHITINIWIFKIDNEQNGRGIAYIALDKVKSFMELKKEKLNGVFQNDEEKFENQLKFILKKTIPKKAEIVSNRLYRGWDEFLTEFCQNRGVIESCPTNSLGGIMASPAISMLIEPDGNIDQVMTYDKINVHYFRNVAASSPLQSIPNLVIY
jgi:hypothetical protein